jgi:muconate cycloisomerase
MRLRSLQLNKINIPLRSYVAHNLGIYNFSESVIVKVTTDEGLSGWGEARPRTYLTGETFGSVEKSITELALNFFLGKEFRSLEAVQRYLHQVVPVQRDQLAAFAGLELAVLDTAGQFFHRHLQRIIGYRINGTFVEAANIGFQTRTIDLPKACLAVRLGGYGAVKVKAGLNDDIERIAMIRRCLGEEIFLWIDANGAWEYDVAVQIIKDYGRFGVNVIEQPVSASAIESLALLREQTEAKIVVDESLCSIMDAQKLIKHRACDIFNIRVGKCGGLLRSLDLVKLAMRHGIKWFLGALVAETGILLQPLKMLARGITGTQIVEGVRQNKSLLADDIVTGCSSCGLGISVSTAKTAQYSTKVTMVDLESGDFTVNQV